MDSNTTAKFRASGQKSCILVKPLWHLDQHNCPNCGMASVHGNHGNDGGLGYSHGFLYILQKAFKASVFLLLQRNSDKILDRLGL